MKTKFKEQLVGKRQLILFLGILYLTFLMGCGASILRGEKLEGGGRVIKTGSYVLRLPDVRTEAVLVLFGGFPEGSSDIQREFPYWNQAKEKGIAILYMEYNRKLWLTDLDKKDLQTELEKILFSYDLIDKKIVIGGFSSGGNLSLLLGSHLVQMNSVVKPKGVFVIDSPVDLLALYRGSKKNVERNFSEVSKQESEMIIQFFDGALGNPATSLDGYKQFSPFVRETQTIENLNYLDGVNIRLYTEPDTVWWMENRQNEWEDMNAFSLQQLTETLNEKWNQPRIEFITTENKGYRSSGQRHPHSWSIVDRENLTKWIMGL